MTLAEKIETPVIGIEGVLSHQFHALWPKISHFFAHFEESSAGEFPAGQLLQACIDGKMQCWLSISEDGEIYALALTEIIGKEFETVIIGFCAGENRLLWQEQMVNTIRDWGRSRGAKRLKAIHRPGWKKMLNGLGLKTSHYVSEVDL